MLQKEQPATGFEDPAQFGQDPGRIAHRAQCLSTNDRVELAVVERNIFAEPMAYIGRPALFLGSRSGIFEKFSMRVDARKTRNLINLIQRLVEPASATDFENATLRQWHNLPSPVLDAVLCASKCDYSRHHMSIVPVL